MRIVETAKFTNVVPAKAGIQYVLGSRFHGGDDSLTGSANTCEAPHQRQVQKVARQMRNKN